MKTDYKLSLFIAIFLLLAQEISFAQNAKYLLIRPAHINDNKLARQNGVLVLSGKDDIDHVEKMFADNKAFAHKCPIQWLVEFWENPDRLTDQITYNLECEKFERQTKQILGMMTEYTNRIESSPIQFLYNVKVAVSEEPQALMKDLGDEFPLFFLYGSTQNLPYITFRLSETIKYGNGTTLEKLEVLEVQNKETVNAKVKDIIAEVEKTEHVEYQSKITFPVSGAGEGELEDVGEVTIKFKKGTDLTKLAANIIEHGGNVKEKKIPDFYYVQLASPQRNVLTIRQQVMDKYTFVDNLFEYPNKK